MQCGRPAGFSDSEDSDDDFFFDAPRKRVNYWRDNVSPGRETESEVQAAVGAGDLHTLTHIINTRLGGDVNARLSSGWTVLLHAAAAPRPAPAPAPSLVPALLAAGADPNLAAEDGVTALMCACEGGDGADVAALAGAGAGVNVSARAGGTALMRAAAAGRPDLLRTLLAREGVNLEMRDSHGWTAVFWAARAGCCESIVLLGEAGARLHERDRAGRAPRDLALAAEHAAAAALLSPPTERPQEPTASKMTHWTDYYPIENIPEYSDEGARVLAAAGVGVPASGVSLRAALCGDVAGLGLLPHARARVWRARRGLHARPFSLRALPGLRAHTHAHYRSGRSERRR